MGEQALGFILEMALDLELGETGSNPDSALYQCRDLNEWLEPADAKLLPYEMGKVQTNYDACHIATSQ